MDWWFIFLPIILAGEVLVWWVCWCKGGDSLSLCSFVFWPHLCQVGAASGAGVRLMRNNEDLTLGSIHIWGRKNILNGVFERIIRMFAK